MPYIGNQHNVGDHINNFKVLDDISSYTATFDGSATSTVDTTNNTIRVPLHRFIQGQRVTYTNGGGGNIGGLTTGTAYFVSFDSANTIKLATSLANANSNTVINLSSVGSGTSHTLNAAFDGINTKFKLSHGSGTAARLNNATQINVAINNVVQRPNLDPNNFTDGFALEDNHKIVFKTAPTNEDIFWGSIIANTIENFDLRDNEVDNFTGNGSATEFTLSTIPANNESVIVTIDGVLQHPSDKDTVRAYTLIDSIIQFTAAPANNAEIQVRHIGFAGASTNDVSGFYGRTGNVVLTANDHITTGDITARNINASGILTASSASFGGNVSIGGTLTYEDVTNIDSVGLVTARDGIFLPDDKHISLGTGNDMRIYSRAGGLNNSFLKKTGTGPLNFDFQGDFLIRNTNGTMRGKFTGPLGAVELHYSGQKKFETTSSGVSITQDLDVDGHTNLDNVSVAGVTTFAGAIVASTFTASSSVAAASLTASSDYPTITLNDTNSENDYQIRNANGTFSIHDLDASAGRLTINSSGVIDLNGNVEANRDLDVDGHTNLDNVSIAGISTATGGSVFGDIQAGVSGLSATIQKTNNSGLYLQYDKPGNLSLCLGGGTVIAHNNFNVAGFSTITGGAELGRLRVGYDNLYLTVQPRSGENILHFNYNNGTITKIGSAQTKSDLEVNGDVYPKASGNRNLGLSTKKWINVYANTFVGNGDFVDLDVDGHTNLDNVSIAGVTTFSSNTIVTDGSNYSITQGSSGVFAIAASEPRIRLIDNESNPNYSIYNTSGVFRIHDETSNVNRLTISSSGNVSITNDLDVDGHTNLDNATIAGITTFTNVVTKFKANNGGNTHLQILSTGSGEAGIFFDAANGDIAGSDYAFIGQQNNLDFVIKANPNAGNIDFQRGTDTKVRIDTSGNLNVNYDLDVDGHTNLDNVSIAGVTTITKGSSGGATANTDSVLTLDNSSHSYLQFRSPNNKEQGLLFGDDADNDAGNIIYDHSDNAFSFATNGGTNERLRIDSSGKVTFTTPGGDDALLIKGDNYTSVRVQSARNSDSDHAMFQMLGSRGTNASPTIIQNNDVVGTINVRAYDGNSYASMADITFEVDGTPGDGDMPGRITFATAADGSQTPTERLRIDSNGDINLGDNPTNQYGYKLNIQDSAIIYAQTASSGGLEAKWHLDNSAELMEFGTVSTDDLALVTNNVPRLRIHSNGQIQMGGTTLINSDPFLTLGQGTSGTGNQLHLVNNGTADLKMSFISAGKQSRAVGIDVSTNNFFIGRDNSDQDITISSAGKVGINKGSPLWMLDVENPNPNNDSKQQIQRWVSGGQNTLELNMYGGNVDQCQFAATNSEQTISFLTGRNSGNQVVSTETTLLMTQNRDVWLQGPGTGDYGGALFIGRSASPYGNLGALRDSNGRPMVYLAGNYPEITLCHEVASNGSHAGTIRFQTYVSSSNTATGDQFTIGTNGPGTVLDIGHGNAGQNANAHNGINNFYGTTRFRVTTSGCQVFGTFSVSSTKNFKISHPLSTKTETHDLVHSSIEGPQADLIYRGVVDLVDGTATVNVDTEGRMTQGTFVALCTNVSCFTSNETDWTAVKGSISGNILTITAQDNTSTATVSWMVVGERKDQGMIDSPDTDDNGRLITEPLKSS